jgi:hypothetical protein
LRSKIVALAVGVAGSIKGGVAGAGVVICCLRRVAVRRAALGSFEVLLSARCSIFAARHHMALAHLLWDEVFAAAPAEFWVGHEVGR